MRVPDVRALSAEQLEEAVAGAEYRNDRSTDWAFADMPVIPMVQRWVIETLLQRIWAGPARFTDALEYLVTERRLAGLPEVPPFYAGPVQVEAAVRRRALKLTLDAYRELHAAVLLRDAVGTEMSMHSEADLRHGYDVVFRPPVSWCHSNPVGVQVMCRERAYVKPRGTQTGGITELRLYVEPPAGGYDGSVTLATRKSVVEQVLHWQDVLAQPPAEVAMT